MTATTETVARSRPVPEILHRARSLTVPALREAVGQLAAELRLPVEYHLGWCDTAGRPTGADGGKFVRPALAVLSAEAAGAPAETGVPGAVAVELLHNFSLLHDDVIDHDTERRHRPTVWATFGIGQAVIGGDALLALAHQTLLDLPGPGARSAARALACATTLLIAGEAEDMAFEERDRVSEEECLDMAMGKTGALLACAASIGAALAEGPAGLYEALADFGLYFGLAFQAVDDVLGIWGDPAVTGKPRGSDLRDRKKTLPITAALASGGAAAEELAHLLSRGLAGEAEVARATALVEAGGGRETTEARAESFLQTALACLEDCDISARVHEELIGLARFVLDREF